MESYDFSGWATRNNLRCSDGRTILKDAFKTNDGQTVPLVWNHQHNESCDVLGHALLELIQIMSVCLERLLQQAQLRLVSFQQQNIFPDTVILVSTAMANFRKYTSTSIR